MLAVQAADGNSISDRPGPGCPASWATTCGVEKSEVWYMSVLNQSRCCCCHSPNHTTISTASQIAQAPLAVRGPTRGPLAAPVQFPPDSKSKSSAQLVSCHDPFPCVTHCVSAAVVCCALRAVLLLAGPHVQSDPGSLCVGRLYVL